MLLELELELELEHEMELELELEVTWKRSGSQPLSMEVVRFA